jgi:hypothetical protein
MNRTNLSTALFRVLLMQPAQDEPRRNIIRVIYPFLGWLRRCRAHFLSWRPWRPLTEPLAPAPKTLIPERFARPDIDQHVGSNASPFRPGFEIAGFGANGLCPGSEFAGSKTRPSGSILIIVVIIIVASAVSLIDRVMRRVALIVPQLSIHAIGGEQLGMRAALDRLAA